MITRLRIEQWWLPSLVSSTKKMSQLVALQFDLQYEDIWFGFSSNHYKNVKLVNKCRCLATALLLVWAGMNWKRNYWESEEVIRLDWPINISYSVALTRHSTSNSVGLCLWVNVIMYQSSMNSFLSVSGSESHSFTWPSLSSLGGNKLLSGWLCATIFLPLERCVLPIVCLVTSWPCLTPDANATLN